MGQPGRPSPPIALRLELACEFSAVPAAARALRLFLAREGCKEAEQTDCELALVEACNNAIEHAPSGGCVPVLVEAGCSAKAIEIRVIDHGSAFAWPERARLPATESESGRGLYLIQKLMDQADYRPGPDGNVLALRKIRAVTT